MKDIIIVDDHPVVIMALRILLDTNGFNVIATLDNGVDALKVIRQKKPDAVIIDISIPKLDGIEVVKRLNQSIAPPKILVLTAQPASIFANRCLHAGASGYVSKLDDLEEVIIGTKAILAGYSYYQNIKKSSKSDEVTQSESDFLDTLSSREIIVLQQLSSGYSNREIAERMLLSEKTISTYKQSIMKKINAQSLVDVVDIARRNGIV
ncbi:response regulator transcription factor [Aeromonas veronii]|uniref:response regulator transcription factor n=1 Tax=Aeromonas veronii TaxID=654 RepID=UPI002B48D706|nr:response regulator transcription factor [Aeromonas veronii]